MAVKNIIAKGIGFSPGTTEWIVTHGFSIGSFVPPTLHTWLRAWVGPVRDWVSTTLRDWGLRDWGDSIT